MRMITKQETNRDFMHLLLTIAIYILFTTRRKILNMNFAFKTRSNNSKNGRFGYKFLRIMQPLIQANTRTILDYAGLSHQCFLLPPSLWVGGYWIFHFDVHSIFEKNGGGGEGVNLFENADLRCFGSCFWACFGSVTTET